MALLKIIGIDRKTLPNPNSQTRLAKLLVTLKNLVKKINNEYPKPAIKASNIPKKVPDKISFDSIIIKTPIIILMKAKIFSLVTLSFKKNTESTIVKIPEA